MKWLNFKRESTKIKAIGRKRYELTKPKDLTKMSIEELEAYLVEKRKIHQEQMK